MTAKKKTITICMGSSCYSRGNVYNVEAIQSWLQQHGLDEKVELRGTLCEGMCRQGPIVTIGDTVYKGVTPSSIIEILAHEFSEVEHG